MGEVAAIPGLYGNKSPFLLFAFFPEYLKAPKLEVGFHHSLALPFIY